MSAQKVYAVNSATGAETLKAQSEVKYDEAAYPLLTYGVVTGWNSPGTPGRGLGTTSRSWLDSNNTWLETHAQYDQCGNVRNAWDAKGNQSQVEYASVNAFAYPTLTRTAVPDPSGQHGSATALVSTSAYDFASGAVVSTTDANNQTTTLEYAAFDVLSNANTLRRLTRVNRPDGSWSAYGYNDDPASLSVLTRTSFDSTRSLEATTYFDGLGRAWRSAQSEGATSILVDTQFDALGRVWKTSNPYRSGDTVLWTTTGYDTLGRVVSLTTPDNAVVTTVYGANQVTVTDQAGKQRRSVSDALGRLMQVYEAPNDAAHNYLTSYAYDTLDNLTSVSQGTQTRTFVYDSLKRLTAATNPESGAICYGTVSAGQCQANGYDANGNLIFKTDARGVVTAYAYDALNRNWNVTYTNDPASTPAVTRTYDGATNGKGRPWKTETSGATGSRTTSNSFDALGRPLSQSQQFYNGSAWSAAYSVAATYDKAGHVLTLTYPSGHTANYGYDNAGRTSSFTGNLGEGVQRTYANEFQYNALGGVQQEKFGTDTALYHKQRFNQRGQVWDMRLSTVPFATDPANGDRGSLINYYSNNFVPGSSAADNNGNLLRQEINVPGSGFFQDNFAYDPLNRLKSVAEKLGGAGSETFKQAYLYDRWGNRTIDQTNTTVNVPRPQYTVNTANNRLNAPAGFTHEYDAAGNQTRDSYTTNSPTAGFRTFDAENRIIAAQKPVSGKVSWAYYTYDGNGQRVRRKIATFEIWQVYGFGGELLAEYPHTGPSLAVSQPQKEYGYRNGQLLVTAEPFDNLAWNSPATQTDSLESTSTAAKAVDGDVDGDLAAERTAATNSHANPWWQVDLGSVQTISSLTVWGRTDCCPEMSSDFYVLVSDVPFTSTDLNTTISQAGVDNYPHTEFAGPAADSAPASIAVNRTGRYVRVQLAGTGSLALAELQIWSAAAKLQWMVADQLGTPRMIVEKSGSLAAVSRHDYLPFGEELFAGTASRTTVQGYSAADGVRQKLAGSERDNETTLDFMQARYFSSAQGRFTSYDPLFVNLKRLIDPQRLNLYSYCRNNPLKYTDKDGVDLLIAAAHEEEARNKYEALQKGLTAEDRKHTQFVVGDGKNGFAKGTFAVTADKDYKSDSENFQTVQQIANAGDTAVLSVVGPTTMVTVYQAVTNQDGSMSINRIDNATFSQNMDIAGLTVFPLPGKPENLDFYSTSKNTEAYAASDGSDEEVTATIHHELRHIVLGDFGRNINRAKHGNGQTETEADRATKAADDEAKRNFKSP